MLTLGIFEEKMLTHFGSVRLIRQLVKLTKMEVEEWS